MPKNGYGQRDLRTGTRPLPLKHLDKFSPEATRLPGLILSLARLIALRPQVPVEASFHEQGDHRHWSNCQLSRLPEEGVDQCRDASRVHTIDVRQPGNCTIRHTWAAPSSVFTHSWLKETEFAQLCCFNSLSISHQGETGVVSDMLGARDWHSAWPKLQTLKHQLPASHPLNSHLHGHSIPSPHEKHEQTNVEVRRLSFPKQNFCLWEPCQGKAADACDLALVPRDAPNCI